MIILIKLVVAHFIGDFLLQPKLWVADKEQKKLESPKFYFHILLHGALPLLILWDWSYWLLCLILMVAHSIIDGIKLYVQRESNKSDLFLIDQGLHFISILILWYIWFNPELNLGEWSENRSVWIYTAALIFITVVSSILIQVLMAKWSKSVKDSNDESLENAGKHIGILERLFVFTFVITGHWEAIGFLLAAKSVFRFGDLKESKDRKLTEYILIGTLLSFGIAIAMGMLVLGLLEFV